ncbi:MAG TPA: DUF6541 family protein [Mycobacteriales bacterium]|nr:DUF6541 family protein [Mycobacteriales bacterium]
MKQGQSPRISGREVLAYVVGGVLLAVVMSWPLARHLGQRIPQDIVDPLNQAWQLAWGGHALRTSPGSLWQANAFFPVPDSLAFSDSLLGYAPISLLLARGTAGVLRAYNVAFLTAYAMCFVGATLLARELGARTSAAVVAGVAFAYAPWRMTHNGHLNILSIGGVALTLFLLLRGYRRSSTPLIIGGWATAAWQLSIGFAMGLFFAYLLMLLGVVTVAWWLRAGRPGIPRTTVIASAAGMLLFLVAAGLLVRPYLRITARYPEAERSIESVDFFSPPPRSLLAAPGEGRVWGERTKAVRDALPFAPEQALFPGVLVIALAGAGLASRRMGRSWRAGLAAGVVISTLLALGTRIGLTRPVYVFLFDHAPGWNAVRTPGRLIAFASLGLALLAALGAHAVQDTLLARDFGRRARGGGSARRGAALAAGVGGVLAAVVFAEGMPLLPQPDVPRRPAALDAVPEARVHLPTDFFHDTAYVYFSTEGFTPISNGSTSFVPPRLERLRQELVTFPDATSVASLQELGLRAVVLHLDRAPGTPWQDTASRPIDGLPLTREVLGDVVVYRLTS